MGHRHCFACLFTGSHAVFFRPAGSLDQSHGPEVLSVDCVGDRRCARLFQVAGVFWQASQVEVETAKRVVAAEARLEARLEAFVLVRSRLIGV
jgi:hypothetical protein